jgi:hypothetical protein
VFLQSLSYCLYYNKCCGGEGGSKKAMYLFLNFLVRIRTDPHNAVSRNGAVYKNVTTTLKENLLLSCPLLFGRLTSFPPLVYNSRAF